MKTMSAVLIVLILVFSCATVTFATESADNQTHADKIDEYVLQQMKEGQIPGLAVGIVENGEITYLKGYGTADDSGTMVTPQTPFTMGSIGKTFTALSIRQLANQGKIDYNATVQMYIPWFTLADSSAASKIRIIDLIGHRSGLSKASGVDPSMYNGKYSIEQIVRKLSNVMPDRPVGSSEEYSNLNFIILGLVIEKVSGMSYGQYLQENVFMPLDMRNSYPSQIEAGNAKLAQGHYVAYGIIVPNNEPLPTGQVPAGFQITSVEDLTRYASFYLNNGYYDGKSIMPGNNLPELKVPFEAFSKVDERYGSYWVTESGVPEGTLGYYGHAGATNGFTSVLLVNPVLKSGIVVLANCRNTVCYPEITAQTIGNGIASILKLGLIPAPVQYGKPGLLIITVVALIILALLVFRAFWARRFRRNIHKGGIHKYFVMASFAALDVLLPIAILAGLPLYFDCTWSYLLNSNMELWILVFTIALLLGGTGLAKIVVMFVHYPVNRVAKT